MLWYFFRSACRHLWLNRLYSGLCIMGLGLAFAIVSLIYVHVTDELSYNNWIPGHDRVYQIGVAGRANGLSTTLPSDVGLWIKEDIPEAEAVTRIFMSGGVISVDNKVVNIPVSWADSNVFEVLPFSVLAGDAEGALDEPGTAVLTRRSAENLFGDADPIGKTVDYNYQNTLRVTAVIEDPPANSTLNYGMLAASHTVFSPAYAQDQTPIRQFGSKAWSFQTFIKVKPGTSLVALTSGLAQMQLQRTPVNDNGRVHENYPLRPVSLSDVHLAEAVNGEVAMDYSEILVFSAVGLLILLAGSINFVNIQVVLGLRQSHEIGIRKSCGADRRQVFWQYMSESVLLVLISAICGVMLAEWLLPALNAYLGKQLDLAYLDNPALLPAMIGFFLLVALLSGLYPSMIAANMRPALVLQDKHSATASKTALVRQLLVVLQFAIMTALLIATIVMYQQFNFGIRESLRRYDDPVLVVQAPCQEALLNSLEQLSGVMDTACSTPTLPQWGMPIMSGISHGENGIGIRNAAVGMGFPELYGMELAAGRYFSEDNALDLPPADNNWENRRESILINEQAAQALAFDSPQDAVGALVTFNHIFQMPATFTGPHQAEIVGVLEDFQSGTVGEAIDPAVFYVNPNMMGAVSIKIAGQLLPETLEQIRQVWDEIGTLGNFGGWFFDQYIENMYSDMRRQSQVFSVLSGIAVIISLLGLLGLASHAAVSRIKEAGIRKCLGSTRIGLTGLFLWQFSWPVVIANLLGWFVAWLVLSAWLDGFASRIDLQFWVFLLAFVMTLGLALMTVSAYIWGLSGSRPALALRYE